jgi:tRNA (cmo5U34)-methyltransferase
MLETLRDALPETAEEILELGCGTGSLTVLVAERYPGSRIMVVDGAAEMVEVTRARLRETHAAAGERARFVTSAFEEIVLEDETYDLITSSLSLHHVADKQPFYARLAEALVPGGKLVFADEMVVNDPEMQQRYWDWWLDFARRPGGLSEAEIEECIEHMNAFDRYETLPRQLEMLTNAGLNDVDCVWRFLNYGVFTGTRAE